MCFALALRCGRGGGVVALCAWARRTVIAYELGQLAFALTLPDDIDKPMDAVATVGEVEEHLLDGYCAGGRS